MKKICCRCHVRKTLSEFYKLSKSPDGYDYKCKVCNKESVIAYQSRYPKRVSTMSKGYKLKSTFGIDNIEYHRILRIQNGTCAICRNPPLSNRRLAVDHCHVTGNIRGLLCTKCNNGLGNFNDNEVILKAAIKYIGDNICEL